MKKFVMLLTSLLILAFILGSTACSGRGLVSPDKLKEFLPVLPHTTTWQLDPCDKVEAFYTEGLGGERGKYTVQDAFLVQGLASSSQTVAQLANNLQIKFDTLVRIVEFPSAGDVTSGNATLFVFEKMVNQSDLTSVLETLGYTWVSIERTTLDFVRAKTTISTVVDYSTAAGAYLSRCDEVQILIYDFGANLAQTLFAPELLSANCVANIPTFSDCTPSQKTTVDGYPAWKIGERDLLVEINNRFVVDLFIEASNSSDSVVYTSFPYQLLNQFSDLIDYDGIAALH